MKDDVYKTFKQHKTYHEFADTPSIQVTDPRPPGVGDVWHPVRTRANYFPSQTGDCYFCGSKLDRSVNREYLSDVVGYCNKKCRKSHETQLISEGRLVISDPWEGQLAKKSGGDGDWATGVWENIASEPIKIRDKTHLKEVCKAHNCMAKGLLKSSSTGKGYEME